MTDILKQCRGCLRVFKVTEFPIESRENKQFPRSRCRDCINAYKRAWEIRRRGGMPRKPKPPLIPLRRSDGATFKSLNDAARRTPGTSVFRIHRALKKGLECAGYKWEML